MNKIIREYSIVALDVDGYEIGSYISGTNKSVAFAEARASFKGDVEWATAGMVRVYVTDDVDNIIWLDLR